MNQKGQTRNEQKSKELKKGQEKYKQTQRHTKWQTLKSYSTQNQKTCYIRNIPLKKDKKRRWRRRSLVSSVYF